MAPKGNNVPNAQCALDLYKNPMSMSGRKVEGLKQIKRGKTIQNETRWIGS